MSREGQEDDKEQRDLATEVKLLSQTVEDNLMRRIDFLERLAFGAIGLVVIGVLCTAGGAILWVLSKIKGV